MGAIASLVAGILGKLIAPLFDLLKTWGVYRAGQKQGRAEQSVADLQETARTVRTANEARANVGTSDADLDRLLKPPGPGGG